MKKLIFLATALALYGEVLKENRLDILDNRAKQIELESKLLKNSWINSVNLEASLAKSSALKNEDSIENFSINFLQEIYKSGGIKAIRDSGKIYNRLNQALLEQEKRELVYQVYEIVLNIKKIDLEIEKTHYLIKNSKIDIKNKKDKYINGLVDMSELDESIIELNSYKNSIEDLKISKNSLLKELKSLSDKNYIDIDIKKFPLFKLDSFIKQNSDLEIQKLQIESKEIDKKVTKSKYLPKVSLFANYQYEDSESFKIDKNSHSYGLKLSIPIDFNYKNDIEKSKLEYLISKLEYREQEENQKNLYQNIAKDLKSIESKIENTKEIIKSYKSLYKMSLELFENSLKSEDDLKIVENRVNSNKIDKKIYKIDRELLILELYKKI